MDSGPRRSPERGAACDFHYHRAMAYDTLQLDTTPAGIALVWLNRPELRNAFNETMIA